MCGHACQRSADGFTIRNNMILILCISVPANWLSKLVNIVCVCLCQGCSLGLERLGLEAVSRRFLERLGLVSVLKVERLGLGSRVSQL